jgi:hypothetical protein
MKLNTIDARDVWNRPTSVRCPVQKPNQPFVMLICHDTAAYPR